MRTSPRRPNLGPTGAVLERGVHRTGKEGQVGVVRTMVGPQGHDADAPEVHPRPLLVPVARVLLDEADPRFEARPIAQEVRDRATAQDLRVPGMSECRARDVEQVVVMRVSHQNRLCIGQVGPVGPEVGVHQNGVRVDLPEDDGAQLRVGEERSRHHHVVGAAHDPATVPQVCHAEGLDPGRSQVQEPGSSRLDRAEAPGREAHDDGRDREATPQWTSTPGVSMRPGLQSPPHRAVISHVGSDPFPRWMGCATHRPSGIPPRARRL